jgi:hypothetical protein
MGLGDWFRRRFSSPAESREEEATLRDEYGTRAESGPNAERPEVPAAIPDSGGIEPYTRPGAPAAAETGRAEGEEAPPDQAS